MNATIINMQDTGTDEGWVPGDFDLLWKLQGSTQEVEVLDVACEVDGKFEHDYHNIRTKSGHFIEGVSGHHLARVTNP